MSSARSLPVSGVAALLVLTSPSEPSGRATSQAQPEPNVPTAVFVNSSLNCANEPNAFLIASASLPVGSPPPLGESEFQKKLWFHTCAALLNRPPCAFFTICSSDMDSISVPLIRLFVLVT